MGQSDDLKLGAATDKLARRIGMNLLVLESRLSQFDEEGVAVVSFTVRLPTTEKPDVLIVLRGATDEGAVVGFHGAATVWEALNGALERVYNRSMKWKEDQGWQR